jgi:NitT/TauT family transport system ATP-binding protein
MARWDGTPFSSEEAARAEAVFRPDLYRAALAGSAAILPGASSKLEGAIGDPLAAGSVQGRLVLGADRFFDGRAFDPDNAQAYLASLP